MAKIDRSGTFDWDEAKRDPRLPEPPATPDSYVLLTDDDRAALREAAQALLQSHTRGEAYDERVIFLAGRIDGLAGRVSQEG